MRRSTIIAILLVCSAEITACSKTPGPDEKTKLNSASTTLAVIPDKVEAGEIVFSSDGRHVAYAAKKDDKVFFAVDNKVGQKSYHDVLNITFGPDNKTTAYRADSDKEKMCIVHDGREGKVYSDLGAPVFSPDGRIIAYEAKTGKQYVMSVGDKETLPFDMPYAPPLFSPDSRRIAYIEQHYDAKKNNLVMCSSNLSNCNKGRDYELINNIVQSPDRSRIAYSVLKNGKRCNVDLDFSGKELTEHEGPAFDEVSGPSFSSDGKQMAYIGKRGRQLVMVLDGTESPFPAKEIASTPMFSPDGAGIAAIGRSGEKAWLVLNGKPGRQYDEIGQTGFSNDGKSTVFPARKGAAWSIVVNGTESSYSYDMIVAPKFSPDGSRIVYRARKDGKRFIVLSDAGGRTLSELPKYEMVWQPVFTPDGKSIAYGVKSGRELLWKVDPIK